MKITTFIYDAPFEVGAPSEDGGIVTVRAMAVEGDKRSLSNYKVMTFLEEDFETLTPPSDDEITNGTYSVPVEVKMYGNESEDSMANGAVVGSAKATVNDDEVTYTITFQGMELQGLYGHLLRMWYYTAEDVKDGSLDDPNPAKITKEYEDWGMDGEGGEKGTYPSEVTFTYEGEHTDKVYIRVEVDAMSSPTIGAGMQDAVLVFDWEDAKKDGGASAGGSSGGTGGGVSESVDVEATTDADGKASAKITANDITSAIDDLNDAAEDDDSKELILEVEADDDASVIETTIPAAAWAKIDSDVDIVTLDTGMASLAIDAETIANIEAASDGDITISVGTVDIAAITNLSEEDKAMIGDSPVYDFTIMNGDTVVSDFDGKITVTLPYELGDDQDAAKIVIYYLADDGTIKEMPGVVYDADSKTVSFSTDHFSSFAVVYDENRVIAAAVSFADVAADDWFYEAVMYAVDNGLFNGTGETTFSPNAPMTRAMLWTVLARMEGIDTDGGEMWYSKGQDWAIASGVSDGTNPDGNITRQELATMLYRYAEAAATTADLSSFSDGADVADWAVEGINWAVAEGLISGMGDGTLAPEGEATRAQVATILMRYLQ